MRADTDLTHVVESYVVENGTKYKTLPPTQDMFEALKQSKKKNAGVLLANLKIICNFTLL
jgi:hypothetical protein